MDKENILNSSGFVLLTIFFGFLFISKAGLNILSSLLFLLSLVYAVAYKKDFFKKNIFLVVLLSPILIGIILSMFSELGFKGPLYFIGRFKYLLIILPLTLFVDSTKKYMILYSAVCISALIAVAYGLITPGGHSYSTFQGFYKIGRTADLMMMLILSVVIFLLFKKKDERIKKNIFIKLLFFLLLSVYLWALFYSGIRGAWVGFIVGILTIFLFHPKKFSFLFLVLVLVIMFNQNGVIKNEFISIFNIKTSESNNTRLQLLKTGLEFSSDHLWFGTGAKNSKKLFLNFFNSQSEEYKEKYFLARKYPKDFHNSYLQILIETGVIVLLLFVFSQIYLIFKMFLFYFKMNKSEDSLFIIITVATSASFFVSQFFHGEFHSYGSLLYYFFLFGSCMITKEYMNNNTFIKSIWK